MPALCQQLSLRGRFAVLPDDCEASLWEAISGGINDFEKKNPTRFGCAHIVPLLFREREGLATHYHLTSSLFPRKIIKIEH